MKISPWIVVNEYCAVRVIEGQNPDNIAARVAMIEKSPRVRIAPCLGEYSHEKDMNNWFYGPKGAGGSGNPEKEQLYGFYPPSRQWCDQELIKLGYILG